jgi:hypothetical protein
LDAAVGPLTPGRLGAVFGFVAGFAATFVYAYAVGKAGEQTGLAALLIGGPAGALLGFVTGRLVQRLGR